MQKFELKDICLLAEQIGALEAQLEGWKRATCFTYQTITLYSKGDDRSFDKMEAKYIDFEVLKTLTIARIEKELNELKTEFEKL